MTLMEKKIYKAPAVEETTVCLWNVLCSSILIDNKEINTGGRAKREDKNVWGNIWK